MDLEGQVKDEVRQSQKMALQLETLRSELANKDRETEEAQCQATSYYNALEVVFLNNIYLSIG